MASSITGGKFDPNTDIPDLSGKVYHCSPLSDICRRRLTDSPAEVQVYVVTGGSAGIGFGIVAHILQHNPAKIYLLSLKEEHAQQALDSLKQYGDPSKVEFLQTQLEDLHQVDQVAKKLKGQLAQLDGLILNAGLGVGVYNETKDGIDSHFQVNVLSQVHLAFSLLPILQKTPNSRLVLQSSDLHRASPSGVKFESLEEINQDIGPSYLYNRTKLGMILFVRALVRRMHERKLGFVSDEQVWINAVHPGAVRTDQQEQAVDAYGWVGKALVAVTTPLMKDAIEEGCRPALFAGTSSDVITDKIQGQYIVPDRKVTSPSSQAQDEALAENLWTLNATLLRRKLGTLEYDM